MSNNAAKKITFAVTNIVVLKSNKKLLSVFFFLYLVNIHIFNYSIKKVMLGENLSSLINIYKEEHI